MPPHLSPPPFPPCHLTSLSTFPTLPSHLSFPPCHLTSLLTFPTLPPHLSPHLSYLATSPFSPPFPPCHLTSLPTFPTLPPHHPPTFPNLSPHHPPTFPTLPPHYPPTFPIFAAHYPPTFAAHYPRARDLTVAISITIYKISHSLIEAQPLPCNTNLRLQIPHTSNSPTPHIYSSPSVLTSFK